MYVVYYLCTLILILKVRKPKKSKTQYNVMLISKHDIFYIFLPVNKPKVPL